MDLEALGPEEVPGRGAPPPPALGVGPPYRSGERKVKFKILKASKIIIQLKLKLNGTTQTAAN